MGELIAPAVGIGLSMVVGMLIGPWRGWTARRRAVRVSRGRPVSFAARVTVNGGRLRRARLVRDGSGLRVRCWAGGFRIPTGSGAAALVPGEDDDLTEWLMERHTDPHGRLVDIGVTAADRAALLALRRAPAARPPRFTLWSLTAAWLLLLGAMFVAALYGVSDDRTATVLDVNGDASSCTVEWTQGGQTRRTHVDCSDAAAVGRTMPIVAQPAPFDGQAVAGERTDALSIDGVILVVAAGILAAGAWRAASPRHPLPLTPIRGGDPTAADGADDSTRPDRGGPEGVVALARRLTARQGWPRHRPPAPRAAPWHTDLVAAVTGVGWWWVVLVLAAVAAILPGRPGIAVSVLATVALTVQVARAVRAWRFLHRLRTAPIGSEWDGVGITAPDGFAVLLCVGDQPWWLVEVATMPPAAGRIGVRGDLGDGSAVRLLPGDGGPAMLGHPSRFTGELEQDLRAYLHDQLDASAVDQE